MNNQQQETPGSGYRVVPASMGKQWLEEAWHFFRSQMRVLLFAVLLLVFIWSLTGVPVLGMVISILSPVFTAGLLLGIRAGFQKPPAKINLLDAWQNQEARKQLVLLGLALTVVTLMFSYLAGPDLTELQLAMANGDIPLESFQWVIFYSLASAALIGFCTWLALPEITFRSSQALPSVILSLRATMANWRALSMLGLWLTLIWVVAVFVVSIASAVLITMLGSTMAGVFVASVPVFVLWLALMALMYVLQYICWRDILADPEMEKLKEPATTQFFDQDDEEQTRVII